MTFQNEECTSQNMLIFYKGGILGHESDLDFGILSAENIPKFKIMYEGNYLYDENFNCTTFNISVTIPANIKTVFCAPQAQELVLYIKGKFNSQQNSGPILIKTSTGKDIHGQYQYGRSIPEN